jgi:hypothetical protein
LVTKLDGPNAARGRENPQALPARKLHVEPQVELELILKESAPVLHANTPLLPDVLADKEANVAQLVAEPQLEKTAGNPPSAATVNLSRVRVVSVPTIARKVLVVLSTDQTAVGPFPFIALTAAPKHVDGPVAIKESEPTVFAVNAQVEEHDAPTLIRNEEDDGLVPAVGPHINTSLAARCTVAVIDPHVVIAPKLVPEPGAKKIGVPAAGTGSIAGTVKTPAVVQLVTATCRLHGVGAAKLEYDAQWLFSTALGVEELTAGSTSDVGRSHDTEPMVTPRLEKGDETVLLRVYVPASPLVPEVCAVIVVFAGMFACVTVMPMSITEFAVVEWTISVASLPDAVAPGVTDVEAEQNAT